MGNREWKNWSGSLRFTPGKVVTPESEDEIVQLIKKARKDNKKLRVVGAGHSSSPLVKTEDILLSLKNFKGVEAPDLQKNLATVLAGMTIKEAGKDLYRHGLAMHNTGDVDVQTVAGAIGTGTHGTGRELPNLSSMLVGVRMFTGTGEIIDTNIEEDKELFRALRVAMGTCGIFIKMRLQLQPFFRLTRKEWCVPLEKCLGNLEELQERNRNFDFYWYPRSDMAKIRVMNKEGEKMPEIPYGKLTFKKEGDSHKVLPRSRHLKFDEMEYALPAKNGPECFLEVRREIKQKWRKDVAWRVLYRTIKADDAFMSSMYGRDSVTISLHHNAGLPFWEYFRAIEPIFRRYGGRPHWGKKHTLKAAELKELFPCWDDFQKYRKRFDPDNIFLSPYMEELLIPKQ
ncbi:D-arabinono-1,4-lactone oxidase [Autumnicola edwardsiae]|uniref:D-arabinono-1,4-lactone oxidase n=1 Tax=Autumnicola edwardsiae TaxID=3075594 RepID=A0ABU3CRM5_9FLAO|nr:D-arabinono-1,4-lactone oxidase [Zunongwangia sp. F297]MDT0649009.1 D-arabinono-1,4-lactone oxidase [Zunongwangia sp. F297]